MEILIKAGQLLLSLSILVVFHEFGHFAFAKLFKTKVEKFYLFFDPWFSLFKVKKGDTEYGIGWLPLGGYVKISGMIDESMDKEQLAKDPEPWEFRSKPAWQRLLIMVGGVLVNLILAGVIYTMVLFVWGEEKLPPQQITSGIQCDSLALSMGLQNGDKIISLDNEPVDDFFEITALIVLNKPETIQVERDGKQLDVQIPETAIASIINKKGSPMLWYRYPFEVMSFSPDSKGQEAGLEVGDVVVGVNDSLLPFFDQYRPYLANHKGEEVTLHVVRNKDTLLLNSSVSDEGLLGVYAMGDWTELFETQKIEYGLFESIPAGMHLGYVKVQDYLKQLKLLFTPDTGAYKSVGSFISIGNLFPAQWDWYSFWMLTAFLSIVLAVMNMLPIPALDGGHVLFLLVEMIVGRKPGDKFMEYAQIAGMVILFALMIFAISNDFKNFVFN